MWFEQFEGAGLDGVIAKGTEDPYREGDRGWLKIKHLRTADCVVAGFRLHKDGAGVGRLLLGLYDTDGTLHHVGVASSFNAKLRAQLVEELEPLRANALDGHPWADWAEAEASRRATQARQPEPVERQEGSEVGAVADRTRRRGRLRAHAGRPVPPHRAVPAVADRSRTGFVHL